MVQTVMVLVDREHKHGDGPLFPRRGQGTTYPRAAYERDINNGYSSVLRDPDGGGYQYKCSTS